MLLIPYPPQLISILGDLWICSPKSDSFFIHIGVAAGVVVYELKSPISNLNLLYIHVIGMVVCQTKRFALGQVAHATSLVEPTPTSLHLSKNYHHRDFAINPPDITPLFAPNLLHHNEPADFVSQTDDLRHPIFQATHVAPQGHR